MSKSKQTVVKKERTPKEQIRYIMKNELKSSSVIHNFMDQEFVGNNPLSILVERTDKEVVQNILENVNVGYDLEKSDIDLISNVVNDSLGKVRSLNNPVVDTKSFFDRIVKNLETQLSDDDTRITTIQNKILGSYEQDIDAGEAYMLAVYIYLFEGLSEILSSLTVAASTEPDPDPDNGPDDESDASVDEDTTEDEVDEDTTEDEVDEDDKEVHMETKDKKDKKTITAERPEKNGSKDNNVEHRFSKSIDAVCDAIIDELFDEVQAGADKYSLDASNKDIVETMDVVCRKYIHGRVTPKDIDTVSSAVIKKNGDRIVMESITALFSSSIEADIEKENREPLDPEEIVTELIYVLFPKIEKIVPEKSTFMKILKINDSEILDIDSFNNIDDLDILGFMIENQDKILNVLGGSPRRYLDLQTFIINTLMDMDDGKVDMDELLEQNKSSIMKKLSDDDMDAITEWFDIDTDKNDRDKDDDDDDDKKKPSALLERRAKRKSRREEYKAEKKVEKKSPKVVSLKDFSSFVDKPAKVSGRDLLKPFRNKAGKVLSSELDDKQKQQLFAILYDMSARETREYFADAEYIHSQDRHKRTDLDIDLALDEGASYYDRKGEVPGKDSAPELPEMEEKRSEKRSRKLFAR